jgi:hypothetical protein
MGRMTSNMQGTEKLKMGGREGGREGGRRKLSKEK